MTPPTLRPETEHATIHTTGTRGDSSQCTPPVRAPSASTQQTSLLLNLSAPVDISAFPHTPCAPHLVVPPHALTPPALVLAVLASRAIPQRAHDPRTMHHSMHGDGVATARAVSHRSGLPTPRPSTPRTPVPLAVLTPDAHADPPLSHPTPDPYQARKPILWGHTQPNPRPRGPGPTHRKSSQQTGAYGFTQHPASRPRPG